jgi:hypothetical protein
MPKIVIISSCVRNGGNCHRFILYFKNYLEENKAGTAEILDQGY